MRFIYFLGLVPKPSHERQTPTNGYRMALRCRLHRSSICRQPAASCRLHATAALPPGRPAHVPTTLPQIQPMESGFRLAANRIAHATQYNAKPTNTYERPGPPEYESSRPNAGPKPQHESGPWARDAPIPIWVRCAQTTARIA